MGISKEVCMGWWWLGGGGVKGLSSNFTRDLHKSIQLQK